MPGRRGKRAAAAAEDAAEPQAAEAGSSAPGSAPADAEAVAEEQPKKKGRKAAVAIPEPAQLCFSLQSPRIRIGCSGYCYQHWRKGAYYPQGLPTAREFEMYSKEFDFLEINNTFYRLPSDDTFDAWRERATVVRSSFEYVVKASQFYTHKKRLNVDQAFTENWARFWAGCQRLRPHLGPILFQFPTNFKTTSKKGKEEISNIDKLRKLGEVLPKEQKFVFEFRDASWFCPEVYEVLCQHDWCLAMVEVHDAPGAGDSSSEDSDEADKFWAGTLRAGPNPRPEEYPVDCCSWGVYVRYHGASGQYQGTYGARRLQAWSDLTAKWAAGGRTVYHAFNNDSISPGARLPSAILDCRSLAGTLRKMGVLG